MILFLNGYFLNKNRKPLNMKVKTDFYKMTNITPKMSDCINIHNFKATDVIQQRSAQLVLVVQQCEGL